MATLKLSKTMQETLDLLITAPYARRERKMIHTELGSGEGNHHGAWIENGIIGLVGHTNTLKALEKRGLVEIIELGGRSADKVKLLQHENTNRPLEEMFNLRPVKVTTIGAIGYFRNGERREYNSKGVEWVQEGRLDLIPAYWDLNEEGKGKGWFVTKIEDAETGEILYTWNEAEARRRYFKLWGKDDANRPSEEELNAHLLEQAATVEVEEEQEQEIEEAPVDLSSVSTEALVQELKNRGYEQLELFSTDHAEPVKQLSIFDEE